MWGERRLSGVPRGWFLWGRAAVRAGGRFFCSVPARRRPRATLTAFTTPSARFEGRRGRICGAQGVRGCWVQRLLLRRGRASERRFRRSHSHTSAQSVKEALRRLEGALTGSLAAKKSRTNRTASGASAGVALAKSSLSNQQQAPADLSEPLGGLGGDAAEAPKTWSYFFGCIGGQKRSNADALSRSQRVNNST